jgi:multiple sugar transport system substrate-binding protein
MEVSGSATDHFVKIETQIAGGAGPDIIQMGGNIYDYAVLKPVLLSMNKYQGNTLNTSVIDESVLAEGQGTWNGQLYGLCLGTNMLVLAYNKSLLQRAGAPIPKPIMTWAEYRAWAQQVAPRLPAGVWPITDNSTDQTNYLKFFTAQQGTPLWNGTTTEVTLPTIQKWIDLWEDFRADKLIPNAETVAGYAETGVDTSMLVAGKAVVALLWSNTFASFQNAMTDELDLIQLPDLQSKAIWIQPSQYITVWKDTPHPDEAVKFTNFFVNDPEAAKVLGNDRGFTSSSIAREAVKAVTTPTDQKVYDYYAAATP